VDAKPKTQNPKPDTQYPNPKLINQKQNVPTQKLTPMTNTIDLESTNP